jgi:xanthine dehydrogenase small subunit
VLPGVEVEEIVVPGPPVSSALRGAGWVEASVLAAALEARAAAAVGPGHPVEVRSAAGARARAVVTGDGAVRVTVAGGAVLDEVVLRSYALGAVHQALGWVRTEGIALGEDGEVLDLTIRSFGILAARDMPPVEVVVEEDPGPAVPVGDTVLAAVAAAAWSAAGLPPWWPVERGGRR